MKMQACPIATGRERWRGTMNKICIRCKNKFAVVRADNQDGFDTHGICAGCLVETLTPTFRKRQAEEGNPDCFGKSSGYCNREGCLYFDLCVKGILPTPKTGARKGNARSV